MIFCRVIFGDLSNLVAFISQEMNIFVSRSDVKKKHDIEFYLSNVIPGLSSLLTSEHECFSIAPMSARPFQEEKKMALQSPKQFCGAGFFVTLGEDKQYRRCGAVEDLESYIRNMILQPGDVYLCISVAWWHDERGYKSMRAFKQQFKRLLK